MVLHVLPRAHQGYDGVHQQSDAVHHGSEQGVRVSVEEEGER